MTSSLYRSPCRNRLFDDGRFCVAGIVEHVLICVQPTVVRRKANVNAMSVARSTRSPSPSGMAPTCVCRPEPPEARGVFMALLSLRMLNPLCCKYPASNALQQAPTPMLENRSCSAAFLRRIETGDNLHGGVAVQKAPATLAVPLRRRAPVPPHSGLSSTFSQRLLVQSGPPSSAKGPSPPNDPRALTLARFRSVCSIRVHTAAKPPLRKASHGRGRMPRKPQKRNRYPISIALPAAPGATS